MEHPFIKITFINQLLKVIIYYELREREFSASEIISSIMGLENLGIDLENYIFETGEFRTLILEQTY